MLIDTHCHLDANEYDADRDAVIHQAQAAGVRAMVVPAVRVRTFDGVRDLAHRHDACFYALGIHPMCVDDALDEDLQALRKWVGQVREDPKFLGIGEIGLDYFVPGLDRDKQVRFYEHQLKLAKEFDLPVILHVRRSQDHVLKYLRRLRVAGGIAHAFNGSFQQAQTFLDLGFVLGFGGAMTFTRALQIRRLAAQLPIEAFVLETDSPDIAPEWINGLRNDPAQLPRIAQVLAELRQLAPEEVVLRTAANARRVLPRLAAILPPT